ncbi:hypothetical protein TB2_025557 [Malus domestica]
MEFPPAFSITFSLSVRAAVAFLDFRAFGSTSLGSLDFRAFGSRADEVVLAITSAAEVVTVGSATLSVTSGTATVAVGTVAVAVSVTCAAVLEANQLLESGSRRQQDTPEQKDVICIEEEERK